MRNVCETHDNFLLAYTTKQDIKSVLPGSLLFALQAPPGTSLDLSTSKSKVFASQINLNSI
jgi:hypothetical protein